MRKVFLLGNDITEFVSEIPTAIQSAGDYGQLVRNDYPSITGNDTRGFWDQQNIASPFYGAVNLRSYDVRIEQGGETVFNGAIQRINSNNDNKTADVQLRSDTQNILELRAPYASPNTVTSPAAIARNICEVFDVPINSSTFAASESQDSADNIEASALWLRPEQSVLDMLQQLAQVSCARVYTLGGRLNWDSYTQRTLAPIHRFTDAIDQPTTIIDAPSSEWVEKQAVDGYRVEWEGGTAEFGVATENLYQISAGGSNPVKLTTLQSAVAVGDRWLSYLQRPQRRITFGTRIALGRALPFNAPIEIEYTRGNWPLTTIDVDSIDNSSQLVSVISGVTR